MQHKINELLETIKQHNAEYRSGHPRVPDSVYDREVEMLRELDPGNEWFKKIEPVNVRERRKAKLPVPMKSLNKVKTLDELARWANGAKLVNDDYVVVMPKFDGLSLLCNENTGEAWSRGGSENEGQDCTDHLIANGTLHDTFYPFTYGEFVFSVKSWTENMSRKINPDTGKPFKSPRNTAAGLLNRDEPTDDLRHVDFYRYGTDEDTIGEFVSYYNMLADMCESFKQPNLSKLFKVKDLTEEVLMGLFKKWRREYYIDGLVIYVDCIKKWRTLGRMATSGNPNYAVAYKHPDFTDSFETTVTGISWKINKSGAFKPVVKIETVDTGDCEMDSPTGYNAGWIRNKEIAKGAKIIVTRSGGVIPKILETLKPAPNSEFFQLWDEMTECPVCGSSLAWDEKHIEIYCTNSLCPGRRLAKIVFFYDAVDAKNMGEETITKIFNAGYNTVSKFLHITFEELMNIPGFGDATANIILENNAMILSGLDLATVMHASDCFPGIGKIKAQQILDDLCPEALETLWLNQPILRWKPSDEVLAGKTKTEQSFWANVSTFNRFVEIAQIKIAKPEKKKVNKEGKYSGMTVCFSGIRDTKLEAEIVAEGGTIASGVSRKTTHLVVKDKNANSSKILKALNLKKPILTMDEFLTL